MICFTLITTDSSQLMALSTYNQLVLMTAMLLVNSAIDQCNWPGSILRPYGKHRFLSLVVIFMPVKIIYSEKSKNFGHFQLMTAEFKILKNELVISWGLFVYIILFKNLFTMYKKRWLYLEVNILRNKFSELFCRNHYNFQWWIAIMLSK